MFCVQILFLGILIYFFSVFSLASDLFTLLLSFLVCNEFVFDQSFIYYYMFALPFCLECFYYCIRWIFFPFIFRCSRKSAAWIIIKMLLLGIPYSGAVFFSSFFALRFCLRRSLCVSALLLSSFCIWSSLLSTVPWRLPILVHHASHLENGFVHHKVE